FLNNADGFVFAKSPSDNVSYQIVPDSLQAFVWGDKWRDLSQTLPGMMHKSQMTMQIIMMVATIILDMVGLGMPLQMAVFAMELSQLMQTLETLCVLKGACTADEAFILGTAITMAITLGVGSLDASTVAEGAGATTSQLAA